MKSFKQFTEAWSKKKYVDLASQASDPDAERAHDPDKIIARAKKHHGDKFAKDLEGIWKQHWPRHGIVGTQQTKRKLPK